MSNFIEKINGLEASLLQAKKDAEKAAAQLAALDDKLLSDCVAKLEKSTRLRGLVSDFLKEFAYMQQHDGSIRESCHDLLFSTLETAEKDRHGAMVALGECKRAVNEVQQRLNSEKDAMVAARVAATGGGVPAAPPVHLNTDNLPHIKGEPLPTLSTPTETQSPSTSSSSAGSSETNAMLRALIVSVAGLEHKIDAMGARLTSVEAKVAAVEVKVETMLGKPPGGSLPGLKTAGYPPGNLKGAGYSASA